MTVRVENAVVVAMTAETEAVLTEGTSLIKEVADCWVVMFIDMNPTAAVKRRIAQFLGSVNWMRR